MIRLFDVSQLIGQDMAVNTDDGGCRVDGGVVECNCNQGVEDAGFDGHDTVLVMRDV